MTAGACKHAKTCPTGDAHEHMNKGGEWSRQCSWHYSQHTRIYKRRTNVDPCGTEYFALNMFLAESAVETSRLVSFFLIALFLLSLILLLWLFLFSVHFVFHIQIIRKF